MSKEQRELEIKAIKDQLNHPENIGTECYVYTRVTGYYRNVDNMNDGKKNECKDRLSYDI